MSLTITANKLAEFITAKTPARRKAIVRQFIQSQHKKRECAPYYRAFQTPARTFLIQGAADLSILDRAVERMKGRNATPWQVIDSGITAKAFAALRELAPKIQKLGLTFHQPDRLLKARLEYSGLKISVTPDLIVHGERNGVPLVGAARFYTAKDAPYQLGERGAALVATMEYVWCRNTATGKHSPDTSLCLVFECIQQRVTKAPDDIQANLAAIERGCSEFVQLWQLLSAEEAA